MIFKCLMLCFAAAIFSGMCHDIGSTHLALALAFISAVALGAAMLAYLQTGGILPDEDEKAHRSGRCRFCGK